MNRANKKKAALLIYRLGRRLPARPPMALATMHVLKDEKAVKVHDTDRLELTPRIPPSVVVPPLRSHRQVQRLWLQCDGT